MASEREAVALATCPHCGAPAALGAAPGVGGAERRACVACGEVFEPAEALGAPPSWLARRGARQWFVAQGERRVGPLTAQEVREALAQGDLTVRCFLWRPGLLRWETLRQLEEFADLGGATPSADPGEIEGEKTRVWHEGEQQHLLSLVAEADLAAQPGDGPTEERSLGGIFGEVDAVARTASVAARSPSPRADASLSASVDSVTIEPIASAAAPIAAATTTASPAGLTLTAMRHDSSVLFALDEQAQGLAAAVNTRSLTAVREGPREERGEASRATQTPLSEGEALAASATSGWAAFAPGATFAGRVPGAGGRRWWALLPLLLVLALAAGLLVYATRGRSPTSGPAAPLAPLSSATAPLPSPALLARPGPAPDAALGPSPALAEPAPSPVVSRPRPAGEEERTIPGATRARSAAATSLRPRQLVAVASAPHGRPWPARVLPRASAPTPREPATPPRMAARAPREAGPPAPALGAGARPLSPQQIAQGIDRARSAIQRCARRHGQAAVVTLALTVDGASGRVRAGRVLSIFAGTVVGACALAAVREGARFRAFSGAPMEVTWPILLR